MINDLPFTLLPASLAICRLSPAEEIPDWARPGDLLAIVRTRDELSIVCDERYVPPNIRAERGWRALKVLGQLDFSLVGILAAVSQTLAQAGVSIFALSTFDTDYILVKSDALDRAVQALRQNGFTVITQTDLS